MVIISDASTFESFFSYFSEKNQPEDLDSITMDDKTTVQEAPRFEKKPWCSQYLKELNEIDSKNYWPSSAIPLPKHNIEVSKTHVLPQDNKSPNPQIINNQTQKPMVLPVHQLAAPISQKAPVSTPVIGYVEGGALYGQLTAGYGIWSNQYLKGFATVDRNNSWGVLLAQDYEYREHGDYAVVDQFHTINEDWYTHFGAGVSNKSIFVPKYYIGGSIARKLLYRRQLIPYLGIHAYWWRPVYAVQDINPGFVYYFQTPWVVEMGSYINRSNPGNIYSASGYIAITQGREKEHYVTLRYGFGKEAYLPLGIGVPAAVGYVSNVITATWRQWLGRDWGTNIVGENYNNPFYKRYAITVGLFKDFAI